MKCEWTKILPVTVERIYQGNLHAVDWLGKGSIDIDNLTHKSHQGGVGGVDEGMSLH